MRANNDKVIAEMRTNFESKIDKIQAENKDVVNAMKQQMEDQQKKTEMEMLRQELQNQQKSFNDAITLLRNEMKGSKGDSTMETMFKTLSESQSKIFETVNKTLEGKIAGLVESNKANMEVFAKMSEMSSTHNKELLSLVSNKDENSMGKTIETFKLLKEVINPEEPAEPMDFGSRLVSAFETLAPRFIEAYEKRREGTPEAMIDKGQLAKSITSS
jgi:uncharacterized protein YhaN